MNEDAEAPEATTLTERTEVRDSGLRVYAFRHRLTRGVLADRDTGTTALELAESIAAGAARVIDKVGLDTLVTGDWSAGVPTGGIREAGAANVAFPRLRAVIGTGALTVQPVADQGSLYHAGVPALLTDQSTASYVGAFDTHCVAHGPDISVLATKVNAQGALVLPAWLGLGAVSPIRRGDEGVEPCPYAAEASGNRAGSQVCRIWPRLESCLERRLISAGMHGPVLITKRCRNRPE